MNLIDFLKKNKESRKIFGKKEIEIIERQKKGINLTQSEKNRLSRDIRVKLRFIKELFRFQDEFDLKKADLIKDLINEAKELILEDKLKNKIKKIYLFGSAVKNELTFKSDIDIAVEFDNIDLKEATKFRLRISGKINEKIDTQVFNILPDKIKTEILKKHRTLYKR